MEEAALSTRQTIDRTSEELEKSERERLRLGAELQRLRKQEEENGKKMSDDELIRMKHVMEVLKSEKSDLLNKLMQEINKRLDDIFVLINIRYDTH